MNIITDTLSIELTQKCNLNCRHCLKGEARNKNMSYEVAEKVFTEVAYIDTLLFTGGEVMYCLDEMKMIIDLIKKKDVTVNYVSFVTNGTVYNQEVLDLLESEFGDNFYFNISDDIYHREAIENMCNGNVEKMKRVYENCLKLSVNKHFNKFQNLGMYLINLGNAALLDVPKVDYTALGYYYSVLRENVMCAGPVIFVDVDGNISDGNMPNDSHEENSLGNVIQERLSEAIINGGIEIEAKDPNECLNIFVEKMNDHQKFRGTCYRYADHRLVSTDSVKPIFSQSDYEEFYKKMIKAGGIISVYDKLNINTDNITKAKRLF